jgi:hypothetical protein
MKKQILLLTFALLSSRAAFAADELPPKAHPDSTKWENLFKPDLSDAVFPQGIWYIEDGAMTASKDEALWTPKDYENFVIDLEFKCGPNANSGVLIYVSDTKNWIPNSVEVQILDDAGDKWQKADPTWKCASIFGRLAPTKSVVKPAGKWNRMTVWAKGQMIYVTLNGELVTQCDMRKWTDSKKNPDGSSIPAWLSKPMAELPTKGKIGLQGKHGGAPIYFRNVKIKQLD